jgi:hypothetical protein
MAESSGKYVGDRDQHMKLVTGERARSTIYLDTDVDDRSTMDTEHLERERHMLNMVSPYMRRYADGNIFFASPYTLRLLALHKRKKFVAMHMAGGNSRAMRESSMSIMFGGHIDKFWRTYRCTDMALASKFRSTSHMSFKSIDAMVVPHIMISETSSNGSCPHIVVFVCYPKLKRIYMYDSMCESSTPALIDRLSSYDVHNQYDYSISRREKMRTPYLGPSVQSVSFDECNDALSAVFEYKWCNYGKRMAFHQLENYMHGLDMVQAGIITGRDCDKRASASLSEQHGEFKPELYKFYQVGFRGGNAQKTYECGLWATLAMRDVACNWRNPSRPHSMSIDPSRKENFFMQPRFTAIEYTAAVVVDILKNFLILWRYVEPRGEKLRMKPLSTLILANTNQKELANLIRSFYNTMCSAVYPSSVDTSSIRVEYIDASQLTTHRSIDALIWLPDFESNMQSERTVYESILATFPVVRFLIEACHGQQVYFNYRDSVDDRRVTPNPAATLIYSVDPRTEQINRDDADLVVPSALYSFSPDRISRKNSFVVELPVRGTEHVQWITGNGWLCYSTQKKEVSEK